MLAHGTLQRFWQKIWVMRGAFFISALIFRLQAEKPDAGNRYVHTRKKTNHQGVKIRAVVSNPACFGYGR